MNQSSNPQPPLADTSKILASLPSLVETVGRAQARKRHGQNFLFDENLCHHIASAVPAASAMDATVQEIGPGPGGLTRALLAAGHQVNAIDIDPDMLSLLQPLQNAFPDHLLLTQADATTLPPIDRPTFITGNLPFHVATRLWTHWLHHPTCIVGMVLMFQAEVGERLIATPRTKAYGRLSVVSQFLFDIEPWLEVTADQFIPPPKVDALVIRALPKTDLAQRLGDFAAVDRWTKLAFAHPRKTLATGLKGKIDHHRELLMQSGINPHQRAEELSVDDFWRLAQAQ